MTEPNAVEAGDFSDLPFDVERHREAIGSFAKMNLDSAAIRPALIARDLVFVRLPSSRLAIGVTDDAGRERSDAVSHGCVGFEVIHEAGSGEEACRVRDEVERYFLRHFPGRTLRRPSDDPITFARRASVYIICYAPAA